jgi:Zn-dependent peptidase ImmA (M78 family)/DNA-binding XRE family transcriptional regulator
MFSKNLKYYRLRKNITKKALASKCGITPMALTNYENGDRRPNMDTLKALAKALGVKVSDFLAVRNENLVFQHAEFRKNSALTVNQQEYTRAAVEEYFNRFYTAIEILGGEVLPDFPKCHQIELKDDDEMNAAMLRKHLGFSAYGPIGDLVESLENIGILIYFFNINNEKFSGMNGFVNGRPYIVVNSNMSTERNRSTISHELSHLMFKWPKDMDESMIEKRATSIAGAFLFSEKDAKRELGVRRKGITGDMRLVCREYGISMMLLAKRAELCNIITKTAAKEFFINASKAGWRKNEPSWVDHEERPQLFNQLVYRAVNEDEISIQKGAELLHMPYSDVKEHCVYIEV